MSRPLAFALLALAGCGGMPVPGALDAERAALVAPGATLADLNAGRTVYLQRCTSCHRPYGPEEHTTERWRRQIAEMRQRAELSPADERVLTAYLVTMSRPASDPPAEAVATVNRAPADPAATASAAPSSPAVPTGTATTGESPLADQELRP